MQVLILVSANTSWATYLEGRTATAAELIDALWGLGDPGHTGRMDRGSRLADRSLFVLPAPHTWEHIPGVTLLGDAAYLMPPVGLGANLAMLDDADLAHALVTESSVDDAVRAYESIMLPGSIEAATGSVKGLDNLVPATTS